MTVSKNKKQFYDFFFYYSFYFIVCIVSDELMKLDILQTVSATAHPAGLSCW